MPNLKIDDNNSLNYQLIPGHRGAPYLVFLHEGLGCIAMWKKFPTLLCRNTNCPGLVYDRLGYGRSSPLNKARTVHYMHEYALNELPNILGKIIPNKPYILIGHSDGGSISLIYGAGHPERLKGIITEAAHVFVDPETIAGIKNADEAWAKGFLKGLSKYHGYKTEIMFKAWSVTWLSNWFRSWNIEDLLPDIEVPLLVIQGADDQYGSINQVNSITSKTSGCSQLEIIENCRHAPHLEAEETILRLMSDFVSQVRYD